MLANGIAKLDDVDAAEPLLAKLEMLAKQKLQLMAERKAIESRRADLLAGQNLLKRMYRQLQERTDSVSEMTYQEKRAALRRLGVSVKLWKMKHEPRYQIDMAVDPGNPLVSQLRLRFPHCKRRRRGRSGLRAQQACVFVKMVVDIHGLRKRASHKLGSTRE